MKIFAIENLDVTGVSCSVPTEENYCSLIKKNVELYSSVDKILLDVSWVRVIKKYGIESTQKIIDSIRTYLGEEYSKCIVISQHINCNMLNWYECDVFSCHASINDNHISIPHWPINCETKNTNQSFQRDVFASFMGSYETHTTRKEISKDSKIQSVNTGKWHFESPSSFKENDYKDLLSRSIYSVCPRGTGHGTIRLWESISSGCIPVIISDGFKVPETLPNDCYILVEEKNAACTSDFLNLDEAWVKRAQEKIFNFHKQYLTPDNFHENIVYYIKDGDA